VKPALTAAFLLLAVPAFAQVPPAPVEDAVGAVVRGLDTATGALTDIDIKTGDTVRFERLEITLKECRYPEENPASDAFAYLVIRDIRETEPRFEGWMIASSPALSAMDHPRYDVWVLHCDFPDSKRPKPQKQTDDTAQPATDAEPAVND